MNRRNFIRTSAFASTALLVPDFLKANSWITKDVYQGKVLVVVQLSGGNDGLNCIVPTAQDTYYQLRPTLGLKGDELIKLSDEASINVAMKGFANLYNENHLGIINSVGYPNPNRSHFRSMDIWQSGSNAEDVLQSGWIGRLLDSTCNGLCAKPYSALELDDTLSLALKGVDKKGLAFRDLQSLKSVSGNEMLSSFAKNNVVEDNDASAVSFLSKTLIDTYSSADYLLSNAKTYQTKIEYPQNEFSNKLKTVAKLINSDSEVMVYYVSLGGFDSHALQKQFQTKALKTLTTGLEAFVNDLKSTGRFNDTLILTFSEFGRRVKQNASNGTDHGTANNVYLVGGSLKQTGFLNEMPNLSDLVDGDLKYQIDFKQIYSTILSKWLNLSANEILGGEYAPLNFI